MEHHLSIFRPYDRDAKHEDQLTRAALIVMKLVPLARDAFLALCHCGQLSSLPKPQFAMQTGKLVPLGIETEEHEVEELVSVLLGPHEDFEAQEPNLAATRKARYDGVIQYGSSLVVVIESKLYATATQQHVEINTGGLMPKTSRISPVRWQDLLDRWWNLLELGVLGPAESDVLNDFFDNAEENFSDLLPYTDLERCADNPGRRVRRLRTILERATGFSADVRDALGHAGVKFPGDHVIAFDRASLYVHGTDIVLSFWPAELAGQYKAVYSDPAKVEELVALTDNPGWQIHGNFHLSFWHASVPRRWYPDRKLPGQVYAKQWLEDFSDQRAGRRPREELKDTGFRRWLVQRGYATASEMTSLDEWADKLPMDKFDVRPGIQMTRSWPYTEAVSLDKAGKLTLAVHDAINELLTALGEPRLEEIPSPQSDAE
nr:hypothetical protein [Mycolicibacterium malmesburyense]CRL71783.1 appr-1-p processing domain-containing protein [Mycolicibacterium malmesburyense]